MSIVRACTSMMCVCAVEELTRKRNELQQKLKHFPTDSLRAKVLKDTIVDGITFMYVFTSVR